MSGVKIACVILRWWLLVCCPKTALPSQSMSWNVELESWKKTTFLCSVIHFLNFFVFSSIYSAWQSSQLMDYISPFLFIISRLSFTVHNSDRSVCAGLCPSVKNFASSLGCSSDVRDRNISEIFRIYVFISVIFCHAVSTAVINLIFWISIHFEGFFNCLCPMLQWFVARENRVEAAAILRLTGW